MQHETRIRDISWWGLTISSCFVGFAILVELDSGRFKVRVFVLSIGSATIRKFVIRGIGRAFRARGETEIRNS